jgi:hypothetical protein
VHNAAMVLHESEDDLETDPESEDDSPDACRYWRMEAKRSRQQVKRLKRGLAVEKLMQEVEILNQEAQDEAKDSRHKGQDY